MRIHGIDYLRVFLNVGAFTLHAAIPYMVWESPVWPVYEGGHLFFDALIFGIHSFQMEAFFLISGFLALKQIQTSILNDFIQNKINKLLIPFLGSMLLFSPLVILCFLLQPIRLQLSPINIDVLVKLYVESWKLIFEHNILTVHFWFLYYLILFTAIFTISVRISWLNNGLQKLFILLNLKNTLIINCAIFSFFTLIPMESWIVLNPKNVYIDVPEFLHYGTFFFLGIQLAKYEHFLKQFKIHYKKYLLACIVIFPLAAKIQEYYPLYQHPYRLYWELGAKISNTLLTFTAIVGLIGLTLNKCTKESSTIRYWSEASYTIYLVNVPILMVIHILLYPLTMPIGIKFLISLIGVSLFAHLIYLFVVRPSFLNTYLGSKTKKI